MGGRPAIELYYVAYTQADRSLGGQGACDKQKQG